MAGLLLFQGRERDRSEPPPGHSSGPGGASNGATGGVSLPPVPPEASPEDLGRFVAECAGLGPAAVPGLLRRLSEGEDRMLQPRWVFDGDGPRGFPTLRAAYIEALRAIPGPEATAALREVLAETASVEETYHLALALDGRAEGGWSGLLLERLTEETEPALLPVQQAMIDLVARKAPEETAERIVRQAPRGEDGTDPRIYARGLAALPAGEAAATARALLLDEEVTPRAKSRYIRSYVDRPEIEVLTELDEVVTTGRLPEDTRRDIAYAAAGSDAFRLDALAYQTALAERDAAGADRLKRRFDMRLEMTVRLVNSALDLDVMSSPDPRAESLRRRLEEARKLVE